MSEKRGVILARISQTNERIPKVEVQEAMCRELCAEHGYAVTQVYVDDGISAFAFAHRPGWEQLMLDVQGGKVDVIVAQSESRFTRQVLEKEALMLACQPHGTFLHTVSEGRTDITLPDGQFMSTLRSALDRLQVATSQFNNRKSNDAHRAKGLPQRGGRRPFGYLDDKVTVHPTEGPLIQEAARDYLAGRATLTGIRAAWNEAGHLPASGSPWTHNKVRQLLIRPRNARLVQHRGELLRSEDGQFKLGEWEPLYSVEDWENLNRLVEGNAKKVGRTVEPKHLCSSLATCGSCGRRLRLATRNRSETAYRCATHETGPVRESGVRHANIRSTILDEAVTAAVVEALLFAPTAGLSDGDESRLAELNGRLAEIRRSDARILDLVDQEVYSDAEVKSKRATLSAEAAAVEAEIRSILGGSVRASLVTEARRALWSSEKPSFEDAATARAGIRERFDLLKLQEKRALIADMLDITVMNGRGPKRVQIRHLVATGLNVA